MRAALFAALVAPKSNEGGIRRKKRKNAQRPFPKVAQASRLSPFNVGCLLAIYRSWMFSTAWRAALYAASNPVQRTFDPQSRLLHHVQVNLRGADVFVPE